MIFDTEVLDADANSLINLGYNYEHGIGVDTDYRKAFELYNKAANLGDTLGINNLGWMYQTGKGVRKNLKKAIEILTPAARQGFPLSMVNLGNIYEELAREAKKKKLHTEEAENNKLSFYWYKKARFLEDRKALFNYANAFHWGYGVEKNYHKAYSIFKKLSSEGDIASTFYVGLYHEKGLAVEQNYKKARSYYRRAADLDDYYSCFNLGMLYETGLGGSRDKSRASYYIHKAADLGDEMAIEYLKQKEQK